MINKGNTETNIEVMEGRPTCVFHQTYTFLHACRHKPEAESHKRSCPSWPVAPSHYTLIVFLFYYCTIILRGKWSFVKKPRRERANFRKCEHSCFLFLISFYDPGRKVKKELFLTFLPGSRISVLGQITHFISTRQTSQISLELRILVNSAFQRRQSTNYTRMYEGLKS